MIGYGREGARLAHLVCSVPLRQAVCGVALEFIPLHQMEPDAVCSACRTRSAVAHPVLTEPETEDEQ